MSLGRSEQIKSGTLNSSGIETCREAPWKNSRIWEYNDSEWTTEGYSELTKLAPPCTQPRSEATDTDGWTLPVLFWTACVFDFGIFVDVNGNRLALLSTDDHRLPGCITGVTLVMGWWFGLLPRPPCLSFGKGCDIGDMMLTSECCADLENHWRQPGTMVFLPTYNPTGAGLIETKYRLLK